jgi:hypothetical protein
MGAPAEVELAQEAGFDGFTAYLAPAVLSLYAICAATVATGRRKGDRGWLPSILGAGLALFYTMGAQVTAHLLAAGHISSGQWLITAVSAVPALSCVSLLHLAAVPRDKAVGVTKPDSGRESPESDENETENPTSDECLASLPKGRSKPSLQALRAAALNIDAVGERVTSSTLAKVFGVSDRTGARYLSQLTA